MSSYSQHIKKRTTELNESALESKHIKFMRWVKQQLEEIEKANDGRDYDAAAILEHNFYRSALEIASEYNPLLEEFTDWVLTADDLITKRY